VIHQGLGDAVDEHAHPPPLIASRMRWRPVSVGADGRRQQGRAAGAQEPSLAGMWQQDTDPRLEVQTTAARSLLTKPGARANLSVEHAADVLYCLLSPEMYLLFVRDRGWTRERWEQWAYDTLHAQLCE
jgi:hypothetical protein